MRYSFLVILFLALAGCNFDSSTRLPEGFDGQDQVGDAGLGCDDFSSSTCGDCGITVCEDQPDGSVNIYCAPDPTPDACEENFSCNSEGLCAPDDTEHECEPNEKRPCGECAFENCQGFRWSGNCVADHLACDPGALCLPDSQGPPSCQAGCSTEGHQMSPWDEKIPDVVDIGEEWDSIDNCPVEDEYSVCVCIIDITTGSPTVVCDPCDWL